MIQIRRILYPCDFSAFSRQALKQAVALARAYRADVTALHVIPLTVIPSATLPFYPNPLLLDPGGQDQIRTALKRFVEPARSAGVRIEAEVREGSAVGQILEAASRLPADLIVMGTHGRSGFERVVLGSVAEKVLRKSPCPVWTAGANDSSAETHHRTLCPVDFSRSSLDALRYAVSFAEKTCGRLVLLHVIDEDCDFPRFHENPTDAERAAQETRVLAALRTEVPGEVWGCHERETVVARGRPYREILRVARERNANLIVMGVQGRGAADLTLFGSTTHRVVRQSSCPVLGVRTALASERVESARADSMSDQVMC
jgi:nucleotide-binding universal stress UspA family protein